MTITSNSLSILEDIMKNKKNVLWILVALIAIISTAVYLTGADLSAITGWTGLVAKAQTEENTVEMPTIIIRPATDVLQVNAAGNIALAEEEAATFQVEGVIAEIEVEVGDAVEAGELLATLETIDLERAIDRAELALKLQQNALDQLLEPVTPAEIKAAKVNLTAAKESLTELQVGPSTAELDAAQTALVAAQVAYQELLDGASEAELTQLSAELHKASITLQQAQGAYNEIAYSDSIGSSQQAMDLQAATIDYDVAKASYDIATASASGSEIQNALEAIKDAQVQLELLEVTTADLTAAEAQVADAEANLAALLTGPTQTEIRAAELAIAQAQIDLQEAEADLSYTRLLAPINGTITAIEAGVGEKVTTDISAGIYIADLTALELTVNVSEVDIGKVYVGQQAQISLDAYPDTAFSGEVSRIAPTSVADSGVVNYEVAIRLDNLNLDGVKSGMTAVASLLGDGSENNWLVPTTSVREYEGENYVRVVTDAGETRVSVTPGTVQGDWTVVQSAELQTGDRVVGQVSIPAGDDTEEVPRGPGMGGGMMRGDG
jgi:HlyD family secretion protein